MDFFIHAEQSKILLAQELRYLHDLSSCNCMHELLVCDDDFANVAVMREYMKIYPRVLHASTLLFPTKKEAVRNDSERVG